MTSIDFRAAARDNLEQYSWVCHPLRRNNEGYVKKPIVEGWQNLKADLEVISALPWEQAEGMGIVLGPASGNLAAIDVDDEELAADSAAWLSRQHICPLMAWTARRRIHVYCIEPTPSRSRKLAMLYHCRRVGIELRAEGNQIAAPPTPPYMFLNATWEPWYGSVGDLWIKMALALGVTYPPADIPSAASGGAGYPRPWQSEAGKGQRNDALFVESCRLAQAGVPYEDALEIVCIRFEKAYEKGGMDRREIERTVKSAFNRVSRSRPTPPTSPEQPIRGLPI